MTLHSWPFNNLRPGHYGAICIDPPWTFETHSDKGHGKSAQRHYDCMTLDEINALPVRDLAAPDCFLWLWATNPLLPQALDVMGAWGFGYVTAGSWVKRGKTSKLAFGTGYIFRSANEMILIGKRGKPRVASRSIRSVIEGPRREHSRKPDQAYDAMNKLFGDVPKADLFAREQRPGWDGWGDELGKLGRAVAA